MKNPCFALDWHTDVGWRCHGNGLPNEQKQHAVGNTNILSAGFASGDGNDLTLTVVP